MFFKQAQFYNIFQAQSIKPKLFCEVSDCCWQIADSSVFRLKIVANRFVYGMVRSIVRCMFDIAKGKRSLEDAAKALDLQDRNLSSTIAPPNGLNLERIYYPFEIF